MENEASQSATTQEGTSDPCCSTMSPEEAFGRNRGWLLKGGLSSFGSRRLAATEQLIAERELWAECSRVKASCDVHC
jgi:hypothetical protein